VWSRCIGVLCYLDGGHFWAVSLRSYLEGQFLLHASLSLTLLSFAHAYSRGCRRFSDIATDHALNTIDATKLHKSWGHDSHSKSERQRRVQEEKTERKNRAQKAAEKRGEAWVEDEENDVDLFSDPGSTSAMNKRKKKELTDKYKAGQYGLATNQKVDAHDNWHAKVKQISDPYNVNANNQEVARGRRTSCALGLNMKEKSNSLVYNTNIQRRKDQARQRLVKKLMKFGSIDQAFEEMDEDGSGDIDFKEFTVSELCLFRSLSIANLYMYHVRVARVISDPSLCMADSRDECVPMGVIACVYQWVLSSCVPMGVTIMRTNGCYHHAYQWVLSSCVFSPFHIPYVSVGVISVAWASFIKVRTQTSCKSWMRMAMGALRWPSCNLSCSARKRLWCPPPQKHS
jgi:hypothetical protein